MSRYFVFMGVFWLILSILLGALILTSPLPQTDVAEIPVQQPDTNYVIQRSNPTEQMIPIVNNVRTSVEITGTVPPLGGANTSVNIIAN